MFKNTEYKIYYFLYGNIIYYVEMDKKYFYYLLDYLFINLYIYIDLFIFFFLFGFFVI